MNSVSDSKTSESPVAALYHGDGFPLNDITAALDAESIQRRSAEDLIQGRSPAGDEPAVFAVDKSLLAGLGTTLDSLPSHVVVVAVDPEAEAALGESAHLSIARLTSPEAILRMLRAGYELATARITSRRAMHELGRTREELRELHRIGMALMTERDPDKLLHQILDQAKRLTQSDAGSLYLAEKDEEGNPRLRFKLSQTESLPDLPFKESTLPISPASLAGYAAFTGQSLVIEDAYETPADAPYKLNRWFDEKFGYRTKSMLVVPMVDHKNVVVGVLQLINRKRQRDAKITSEAAAAKYVLPYTDHELQLVQSLAGQAAISIENSQLYAQIEHLFESFVKAAVTAIDQRDPTTAGHSIRVATFTADIASAVERAGTGPYKDTTFTREQMRELRYAAMLHDFGKVGVREEVLVKSKKLPPYLWERVESRFDLIKRTVEADFHRKRAELLISGRKDLAEEIEKEYVSQIQQLDQFQFAVRTANEPSVLPEDAAGILVDISKQKFQRPDGVITPYLAPDELHFLQIPK